MEPQWTRAISSEVVCNFFYFFFVIYAVLAVFAVFSFIALFFGDLPKNVLIPTAVQSLLMLALAGTTALFHYLVCARALVSSMVKSG